MITYDSVAYSLQKPLSRLRGLIVNFVALVVLIYCSGISANTALGGSTDATKEHPANHIAVVLCSYVMRNDEIVKNSEEALYEMVGELLKPTIPSKIDILEYLNEHSEKMLCDEDLHYLKLAVKENLQLVFITGLFNREERFYTPELQLDFNTITPTLNPATGKEEPMTLLDYINKVALPPLEDSIDSREKKLRGKLKAFKSLITNEITKKLKKPNRFNTDAKTFEQLKEEMTEAELSKWDCRIAGSKRACDYQEI